MKFSNKQKQILYKKIQRFQGNRACGYLTPIEILYLLSIGCKSESTWRLDEEFEKAVKNGISYSTWYYFIPTKDVAEELRKNEKSNYN